jgi:hypothetical protein
MGRLDGSTARRGVGGHPAMRAERHVGNDVFALDAKHRFIWTHVVVLFVQECCVQHGP